MFELGDFSEVAPHGKFKAFLDFFLFFYMLQSSPADEALTCFSKELNLKFILDIKKLNHATKSSSDKLPLTF